MSIHIGRNICIYIFILFMLPSSHWIIHFHFNVSTLIAQCEKCHARGRWQWRETLFKLNNKENYFYAFRRWNLHIILFVLFCFVTLNDMLNSFILIGNFIACPLCLFAKSRPMLKNEVLTVTFTNQYPLENYNFLLISCLKMYGKFFPYFCSYDILVD